MEKTPGKVDRHDTVNRVKARLYTSTAKTAASGDRYIQEWVSFACEANGVPELAQVIVVEWNARFTRRMGDALYSPSTFRARIRLSIPLWGRASEQDRRETVIHEACHLVVYYKNCNAAQHGPEWREAMRNCGVEPQRTHSVDRTGLTRRGR